MSMLTGPGLSAATLSPANSACLELETRAKADPLAFLDECRAAYDKTIHDYRCRFLKQERVSGELGVEQEIDVQFRESPFSVHMKWVKNPGAAVEATYVAGRWKDDDGAELASFKPSGVISLLVPEIKLSIHGDQARKDSRRSLDQFGFKNTLDLVIKYARLAVGDPQYRLTYTGPGRLDGRDTFTFERRLPYTGEGGAYPDRLMILHIDQEWLVPSACITYADDERAQLLGSYILTQVRLNVGVDSAPFDAVASAQD
ncbi:MAG: DUF1571 domain-containing protein [Phycisphaerales bacterium]|nr:DUF1571 domain-containing protein [Phycisphaerales bacterium]